MLTVNKCGIKFTPPSIVVTYAGEKNKLRARIIPVRNFKSTLSAEKLVDDMKKLSPSFEKYLEQIPPRQLIKLVQMIKDCKNGVDEKEIISRAKKMMQLDPNEDLNKVNDDILETKKALMEQTFKKNQIKPGDDNFEYDVEVNFDNEILETHEWDDSSDLEAF